LAPNGVAKAVWPQFRRQAKETGPISGRRRVMKARDKMSCEKGPAQPGRRRKRSDAAYERWLAGQLRELYNPVLREPVPEELERLLDGFVPRPKAGSGKP
jgi:hypothetical protein